MTKALFRSVLLYAIILAFSSCSRINRTTSLKLAHGLDVNHPVHKGMEYMARLVAEKSEGRMEIEIYPGGQLGSERQNLELLQIGSLGMTKVSASVMENFAPNLKVFSLPYIFHDKEHAYAVLDGPVGKNLLLQSQDFWLRGLTFFDAGNRSFYTKDKQINTPEDLKGMKIRVQESQTSMNMIKAMGGAPTPISWGELYTALQQGVVDGAENNPPSFFLSRHYEVCKYYTINEHTSVPDILVIGTTAWNRLTPQEQQWLEEAAREATEYQRELWEAAEKEALDAVKAAGVEVTYPDKQPFAKSVEALYESYMEDREVFDLIQEIRNYPYDKQTNENSND
jgi:tripartite ATP-independent transporter DctP family solute receptor